MCLQRCGRHPDGVSRDARQWHLFAAAVPRKGEESLPPECVGVSDDTKAEVVVWKAEQHAAERAPWRVCYLRRQVAQD